MTSPLNINETSFRINELSPQICDLSTYLILIRPHFVETRYLHKYVTSPLNINETSFRIINETSFRIINETSFRINELSLQICDLST